MVGNLICWECGHKYGKIRHKDEVATYYRGFCDYCKHLTSVTEARDFCYPELPVLNAYSGKGTDEKTNQET